MLELVSPVPMSRSGNMDGPPGMPCTQWVCITAKEHVCLGKLPFIAGLLFVPDAYITSSLKTLAVDTVMRRAWLRPPHQGCTGTLRACGELLLPTNESTFGVSELVDGERPNSFY